MYIKKSVSGILWCWGQKVFCPQLLPDCSALRALAILKNKLHFRSACCRGIRHKLEQAPASSSLLAHIHTRSLRVPYIIKVRIATRLRAPAILPVFAFRAIALHRSYRSGCRMSAHPCAQARSLRCICQHFYSIFMFLRVPSAKLVLQVNLHPSFDPFDPGIIL